MSLKVLIIDDDEVVLYIHKIMVMNSNLSLDPITFLNGKKTLDFLISDYSPAHKYLLLLDINMPIMNGWELLEAINSHGLIDNISVIMATSSINLADKNQSEKYGQVIAYAEKPISEEICQTFKNLPELAGYFN
ncbi:MAG: response regulator [Opitutaceae bacterium]|nr:response regulator [Cytophagales bacterium]